MEAPKEILKNLPPFIRIYKDGTVERPLGTHTIPPSTLSAVGISSKDVVISPQVSARLYIPHSSLSSSPITKLATIVYFHGGAFVIGSPFSPFYNGYIETLSAKANALIVSVSYRLAPEHPLPTAYNDSWAAIEWTVSLSDEWLNDHADLNRIFLAGDSAGANITHQMAMRAGTKGSPIGLRGVVLVHPFFWGSDLSEEEEERSWSVNQMWTVACPTSDGIDDPWINPRAETAPPLKELGCQRVLVCLAGVDFLREKGKAYYEALRESGWEGVAEVVEVAEEGHAFHLFNQGCENAVKLMERIVDFISSGGTS
ncbi:hypothetical protein AMTRI_Chr04g185770 [Amborella trichopoda]|uniref:probable carboxylesterase 2 n=1 Tax=Amborella trichopoda TaxID=13333 RepID=UPI0005D3C6D0|nr:probable carboxylesterase 2 [Amborella trichopoda]|eukprot:XP_011629233.1 probable carboxylesterase 2 [Amborella trichopoda]